MTVVHMCVLFGEVSMQNRNRLIDTEKRLMIVRGVGIEGWVKKVKEWKSTVLQLQNSHRNVKV